MPLNMNETKAPAKPRQLIEDGQHMARIVQIVDFGLQEQRPYKGEEKPPAFELYITFEFPNQRIDVDGESKPMWKSRRIKLSSHEKSLCYKWYQKLDPKNEFNGDWSKLINKECAVLIVQEAGKGKNEGRTFDKIADVMPLMAGMTVPPLENDPVVFDLGSPNMDIFESFPDWQQNIIKENLQYDGSKLQNLVEGNPVKYTARAPGDAPLDQDADSTSSDMAAEAPSIPEPQGEDDPW